MNVRQRKKFTNTFEIERPDRKTSCKSKEVSKLKQTIPLQKQQQEHQPQQPPVLDPRDQTVASPAFTRTGVIKRRKRTDKDGATKKVI